jgi:hypothetical protein
MISRIAPWSVAVLLLVFPPARASASDAARDPARIEGIEWSTPDHDGDGRSDWLELDVSLRLPPGGNCVGWSRLEEAGRHVADATTVAEMEYSGMLQAIQILGCDADSSGLCTLRLAFDGAAIHSRVRDGPVTAHVEILWRGPEGRHAYYGTIRRDVTSPSLKSASFRRAPYIRDDDLPQSDRRLDSIQTVRATEERKASITNARWSAVDGDHDGLKEWLQVDIDVAVPTGTECSPSESWLEQDVPERGTRMIATDQNVDRLRAGGPTREGNRWVRADSSGRCTLRIGFDGDSLRTFARDGDWTAHLVVSWRHPGAETRYSIEKNLEIPLQRAASYGRTAAGSR